MSRKGMIASFCSEKFDFKVGTEKEKLIELVSFAIEHRVVYIDSSYFEEVFC